MRKIGTISAAAGFIFLGIWMIINKSNPVLADQIFKWWPAIIILLGVEVLISFSINREDGKRTGFNGLIILVIVIFLIVNTLQGFTNFLGITSGGGFSFDRIIRWGENIDLHNYKEISASKVLSPYGKRFSFEADSSLIRFIKSPDGKIRIDAKVYVDKGSSRNSYVIEESKDADGYDVSMKESFIRRVSADIYIPDGYTIGLKTDSSSIKTDDSFPETDYDINTSSSNIELNGGKSLILNIDSGTMKISDIKNVRIKGNSGTINISGNTEVLDASLDSGTFSLNNNLCRNIKVGLDSGMVTIRTKDRNVSVASELGSGLCTVNNERRVNSGVDKVIGTGEGKVNIRLDSGTIKFSSQE